MDIFLIEGRKERKEWYHYGSMLQSSGSNYINNTSLNLVHNTATGGGSNNDRIFLMCYYIRKIYKISMYSL